MERNHYQSHLISFLRDEFDLEEVVIAIALKRWGNDTDPLHMILWQYGLISIEQLGRVFDWLRDQTLSLAPLTLLSYSKGELP